MNLQVLNKQNIIINDNFKKNENICSVSLSSSACCCPFRAFYCLLSFFHPVFERGWLCLLFSSSAFHLLYETNCKFLSELCLTVDCIQFFFLLHQIRPSPTLQTGKHFPWHAFCTFCLAWENLDHQLWGDNYSAQLMKGWLWVMTRGFPRSSFPWGRVWLNELGRARYAQHFDIKEQNKLFHYFLLLNAFFRAVSKKKHILSSECCRNRQNTRKKTECFSWNLNESLSRFFFKLMFFSENICMCLRSECF